MEHRNRRSMLCGLGGAAMALPLLSTQTAHANPPVQPKPRRLPPERMALLEKVNGEGAHKEEQIAMLLYPGFTALDLVGPHYYLACMLGATVHLVTTEADLSLVPSDLGLAINPTIRMADVPANLDILFIPGGTAGTLSIMQRADVVGWIRDRGARAKYVTSVCTGSMVLAKAGFLNGKRATSHWATRPILADYGAIPVDERVVFDGNVITGAGVSAGIDFAISLVERLRGRNYAEGLVLQSEYAPQPPIIGGALATTSAPVGDMMQRFFEPVQQQFRALAP
jgi:cyclohexyl-isocyanide hydratase